MTTQIYLELGAKRTFACAVDWPGWARSAPRRAAMGDPDAGAAALDALVAYLPRYAQVAAAAGLGRSDRPSVEALDVVQRLPGDMTTDFGAPGAIPDVDHQPLPAGEAARLGLLLGACWQKLDAVAGTAPAQLRKGPRGGGRDRDAVVDHVVEAERSYLRKIGLSTGKAVAPAQWRAALLEALRDGHPLAGGPWPVRYVVRRTAWHVLDHAWEIEDRST
jgi:hypothetical protein